MATGVGAGGAGRMAAGALLLAGAAYAAGASSQPAALAACGVAALAAVVMLRRAWTAHGSSGLPFETVAAATPLPQSLNEALVLETRLECAPIALFLLQAGTAAPLNASARRLLAPGRVADPTALFGALAGLAAGQRRLVEFDTEAGSERGLACANVMTVAGRTEHLVALMPVEGELAAEAMQAWQKLVHVLTHEIMNSLTPVASLSATSRELLADAGLPADIAADLDTALDAISRRADSLATFVKGYRTLATVPDAQMQAIDMQQLFARLASLVGHSWLARGGVALFSVEPASLQLRGDPGQLEQALASLLTNAAEATADTAEPQVAVSARLTHGGRLRIDVSDNGPGVPAGIAADIFTPFFSTKAHGSGIGLAMARQLVHRNGGSIRYARSVAGGARFVITF